jgi:amino acid transporter
LSIGDSTLGIVSMRYRVGALRGKEGPRMDDAGGDESRGLARGVVGSARVIAFGASNVTPAGAVVGGLVIAVSYAGFASPLVVLIAFVASGCCASSIAEFGRRLPSAADPRQSQGIR